MRIKLSKHVYVPRDQDNFSANYKKVFNNRNVIIIYSEDIKLLFGKPD